MIIRPIKDSDYEVLYKSLENDEFHKDTNPMFFVEIGTITRVYEDDEGIVLFVRGKPIVEDNITSIQLDIQFLDNKEGRRNLKIMLEGFPKIAAKAKENGFHHIDFESVSPMLRKFCIKRLGFVKSVDNNLRYML